MIKILHILPSLNVGAGMPSLIMNYYRNINRNEIQFDFMYFVESQVDYSKQILSLGGKIYKSPYPGISIGFHKYIADFFTEHSNEYKAIHCHPIFAGGIFGYYARKHGIRHVIAHSHSSKYSEKSISAIRNRLLMGIVHKYTTDYVACSRSAAALFGKKRQEKAFILKNAIDCQAFKYSITRRDKIRKEFNIPDNVKVIGHVGRFTAEKNHIFLLDVFHECLKNNSNIVLMLVGDGILLNNVKTHSANIGIDRQVIFTGKRKDIGDLLSGFDVFAFPSTFEGFGLSLLEAEASGVYCVASDGLPNEVFVSDNVCKVKLEDKQKWIEAMLAIPQNNAIPREDYSNIVHDHGFDIQQSTKELEKYYLELD